MRTWAGVSAVASALQRRVWARIGGQVLYPNLYILLVSDPGVGKSNAIKYARGIVRRVQTLRLSPTRITQAAFYLELEAAKGTMIDTENNTMYRYHALSAMIDEFSVFVRPSATEFMADLADLFDCPDPFESKTKTQGENIFPNSLLNVIGGCTAGYLKEAWTRTVLDQGLPSRVILVHSNEIIKVELFSDNDDLAEEADSAVKTSLSKDLEIISALRGRFTWDPRAAKEFAEWHEAGMPPIPKDPRLMHYMQRRVIHFTKLCMVFSASLRGDLEITLEDLARAKELLLLTENTMPRAMEQMGANPMRDQMMMVINLVHKNASNGKGVPEHVIRTFLLDEVDPMRVRSLIQELVHSRQVFAVGETEGQRMFYATKPK